MSHTMHCFCLAITAVLSVLAAGLLAYPAGSIVAIPYPQSFAHCFNPCLIQSPVQLPAQPLPIVCAGLRPPPVPYVSVMISLNLQFGITDSTHCQPFPSVIISCQAGGGTRIGPRTASRHSIPTLAEGSFTCKIQS